MTSLESSEVAVQLDQHHLPETNSCIAHMQTVWSAHR